MRFSSLVCASLLSLLAGTVAPSAMASNITYITPTNPSNTNTTWPAGSTYNFNMGYAFTTGSSGPYDIDWITVGLNTSSSTAATGSLKVAIHSTTNSTAYSAVASATAHATDTVTFAMPGTTSTNFTVNLTAADLPFISNYQLLSSTSYALIFYAPSPSIAMQRTTGFANGTTNGQYTVTNGFTMLDTFKNNTANYSNSASSFPTLAISFGSTGSAPSAVPEPSTVALCTLLVGGVLVRRYRTRRPANRN